MIIYPKFYCESVRDIKYEFLQANNIKGIILDVDNTLIDFDRKMLIGAEEWAKIIKQNGIKLIKKRLHRSLFFITISNCI